jgi:hypothetical protein
MAPPRIPNEPMHGTRKTVQSKSIYTHKFPIDHTSSRIVFLSGILDPGAWIQGLGAGILGPESWNQNPRSEIPPPYDCLLRGKTDITSLTSSHDQFDISTLTTFLHLAVGNSHPSLTHTHTHCIQQEMYRCGCVR